MDCSYCHHEGNYHGSTLTLEQIENICNITEKHKIKSIKITGGEPLLHPNILEIIRKFSVIPSVKDIAITTNGILLEEMATNLKSVGLKRINIGCDSLKNDNLKSIGRVRNGLKAAKKVGFQSIKINMVLLKGVNEDEVDDMIDFAAENGFILQIIELINTESTYFEKFHVSLEKIENKLSKISEKVVTRNLHHRKQYFLKKGAIVELVKPVHNAEFCQNCHTLRITSDFQFQPCLNRNDNFIPINKDIEISLQKALDRRVPFNAV